MYRYDRYADKVLAWGGETALGAPNDISHVTPQYHVFRRLQKKLRIFLFYPLFSRFQENYSLVLNFTPYFHEQGVDYPFGKTLVRALCRCCSFDRSTSGLPSFTINDSRAFHAFRKPNKRFNPVEATTPQCCSNYQCYSSVHDYCLQVLCKSDSCVATLHCVYWSRDLRDIRKKKKTVSSGALSQ